MKRVEIIPGSRFNNLVVVDEAPRIIYGKRSVRAVNALCDCGNLIHCRYSSLVTGNTTSCGCTGVKYVTPQNRLKKLVSVLKDRPFIRVDDFEIKDMNQELTFQCNECGQFFKRSFSVAITKKYNCPYHSKHGFRAELPAELYILRVMDKNNNTLCYKYGISNDLKNRHKELNRKYSEGYFEILYSWQYDLGSLAREHESTFKKIFKRKLSKKDLADGWTETFSVDFLETFFIIQQSQYEEGVLSGYLN